MFVPDTIVVVSFLSTLHPSLVNPRPKLKRMATMMKLVFSSSIALQTQLQLVPLNDEECIGAKVLAIGNDESAGSMVNNGGCGWPECECCGALL